jgi:hypothetical protein
MILKEYFLTHQKEMIDLGITKVKVNEESIFLYPIQELFSLEACSKFFYEIYGEEELMKYLYEMINDEIKLGKTSKGKFYFNYFKNI